MSYDDSDIESFTITRRSEIVFYLHQLINDQEPLSVMFDDGRESMLTVALDLDDQTGQLVLDWGGSEAVNRKLLKASSATFVASPLGVRNLFQTGTLKETTYKGRSAFTTALPVKYVRLQRREYFRLTLPMARRVPCKFDIVRGGDVKRMQMTVIDICIGGLGIEMKGSLALERGEMISKAVVDLDKFGLLQADMEVRFSSIYTRGFDKVTRAGCQFVKLGSAGEVAIQRFISQIQRDQKARLG